MRTMCVLVVGLERENGEELTQFSWTEILCLGVGRTEVITITAAEP